MKRIAMMAVVVVAIVGVLPVAAFFEGLLM